jgi:hypothetical protein
MKKLTLAIVGIVSMGLCQAAALKRERIILNNYQSNKVSVVYENSLITTLRGCEKNYSFQILPKGKLSFYVNGDEIASATLSPNSYSLPFFYVATHSSRPYILTGGDVFYFDTTVELGLRGESACKSSIIPSANDK